MIIQCKRCETKFRFDESLLTGEGLWVRCSRCRHVFFQEGALPSTGDAQSARREETAAAGVEKPVQTRSQAGETAKTDTPAPEEKRVSAAADDADELEIDKAEENLEELSAAVEEEEETPRKAKRKKGILTPVRIVLYGLLLIVLLMAVFFRFFPQGGDSILQGVFQAIPAVERLWGPEKSSQEFSLRQIEIRDVRQRFVNNGIMGKIRVVEGTTVNGSSFTVARIKIKGELYDAYGVVLTDRVAHAGNILVDEALWVLTEEAIANELSSPQGNTVSNERVPPGGKIPFMVVFAHEPPGVAKATVMVAGAEKILP